MSLEASFILSARFLRDLAGGRTLAVVLALQEDDRPLAGEDEGWPREPEVLGVSCLGDLRLEGRSRGSSFSSSSSLAQGEVSFVCLAEETTPLGSLSPVLSLQVAEGGAGSRT